MDVEVVPFTPDHWSALASLFEESGDQNECWCQFFHKRGSWIRTDPAANRAALEAEADARPAAGLIALDADGRAVGWVRLGPRAGFARLDRSTVRPRLDDVPVWSIVCFVVSRNARHQGVTSRLLEAAIEFARAHGAPALEAYPVDQSGRRVSAANLYRGALSTFRRAGFEVAREITAPGANEPRKIVRLTL